MFRAGGQLFGLPGRAFPVMRPFRTEFERGEVGCETFESAGPDGTARIVFSRERRRCIPRQSLPVIPLRVCSGDRSHAMLRWRPVFPFFSGPVGMTMTKRVSARIKITKTCTGW